MVMRITNQIQQANSLRNIFRITEDLFRANERVATGKRINRPSDDPAGVRDVLSLRTSIDQSEQFSRNIENNKLFIEIADSALDSAGLGMVRARELALGALSGTDTADTRSFAALEIDTILDELMQNANAKVENRFIFSGTRILVEPFQADPAGSGTIYTGNSESFRIEIAPGQTIAVTRPGSDVYATDLDPDLNGNTLLANLNAGSGVPPGSFTITDRAGNTATINIVAGMTVNNVISAINGAGINVSASINSRGTGFSLIDTSTTILQSLTVAEVGTGTTAASLGIVGKQDGPLEGSDLDPVVTSNTLIADLNGGQGLSLDQVNIVNGAASGTLSLSTAATVGDVLAIINGAGLNVTASINSQGNSLRVVSNDPTSAAVVRDVGLGKTASELGIGGGQNVFVTLEKLKEALEKDDSPGIIASLDNLDASLNQVENFRADYGAILKRMENTDTLHESDVVNQKSQLSTIEDSDAAQDASDIAALEFALQATLDVTARVLQPSLLDFLR